MTIVWIWYRFCVTADSEQKVDIVVLGAHVDILNIPNMLKNPENLQNIRDGKMLHLWVEKWLHSAL